MAVTRIWDADNNQWQIVGGTIEGDPATGYLPLTGGVLTGPLVLAGNPTVPLGAATKAYVDAMGGGGGGGGMPTGAIVMFGGTTPPTGFLMCNGQTVSRITYDALFAAIGTAFGAGDGSTTFGLPDMRQRFPIGVAASGTASVLGQPGGNIDHTHTGPSHTHTGPSHTHTGPSHTHSVSANTSTAASHDHGDTGGAVHSDSAGGRVYWYGGNPPAYGASTDYHIHGLSAAGSHAHSFSDTSSASGTANTGAGGTGATGAGGTQATGIANPPFLPLNFIIKV